MIKLCFYWVRDCWYMIDICRLDSWESRPFVSYHFCPVCWMNSDGISHKSLGPINYVFQSSLGVKSSIWPEWSFWWNWSFSHTWIRYVSLLSIMIWNCSSGNLFVSCHWHMLFLFSKMPSMMLILIFEFVRYDDLWMWI